MKPLFLLSLLGAGFLLPACFPREQGAGEAGLATAEGGSGGATSGTASSQDYAVTQSRMSAGSTATGSQNYGAVSTAGRAVGGQVAGSQDYTVLPSANSQ